MNSEAGRDREKKAQIRSPKPRQRGIIKLLSAFATSRGVSGGPTTFQLALDALGPELDFGVLSA